MASFSFVSSIIITTLILVFAITNAEQQQQQQQQQPSDRSRRKIQVDLKEKMEVDNFIEKPHYEAIKPIYLSEPDLEEMKSRSGLNLDRDGDDMDKIANSGYGRDELTRSRFVWCGINDYFTIEQRHTIARKVRKFLNLAFQGTDGEYHFHLAQPTDEEVIGSEEAERRGIRRLKSGNANVSYLNLRWGCQCEDDEAVGDTVRSRRLASTSTEPSPAERFEQGLQALVNKMANLGFMKGLTALEVSSDGFGHSFYVHVT